MGVVLRYITVGGLSLDAHETVNTTPWLARVGEKGGFIIFLAAQSDSIPRGLASF